MMSQWPKFVNKNHEARRPEKIIDVIHNGELLKIRRSQIKIRDKLYISLKDNQSISCALPTYTLPQVKNAAGYYIFPNSDLIDLFIGGEGTLGFISQIELCLAELPYENFTCMIFFQSSSSAFSFVQKLKKRSFLNRKLNEKMDIDANCIECFDQNSLAILREKYYSSSLPKTSADVAFHHEA